MYNHIVTEKERERLLYKILAGKERVILSDNGVKKPFWIKSPSLEDQLIACDIYDEALSEAELNELMTEEEAIEVAIRKGFWGGKKEEDLKIAIENIDKLKVGLYKAVKKLEKEKAREALKTTREFIKELNQLKYKFASKTCEHFANIVKYKYLIGSGLYYINDKKVWERNEMLEDQSHLLEDAYISSLLNRISEQQIRELARNDPWRPIWIAKEVEGKIFGKPACELSDEQKAIISWSRLYDSCHEDPNKPPDSVIEEDDMFDGWLIVRKKEKEKEMKKSKWETAIENPKIANAQEIFIQAADPGKGFGELTDEDLEEINDMNDGQAIKLKNERMNAIKHFGEIKEADMPDTSRYIQMELNKMKGRK